MGILALIVVIITLLEFSEILPREYNTALFIINISILAIFMGDFVFRFMAEDDKKKFLKDPFNICDLIAIIPFELILFIPGLTAFRGLRQPD